MGFNSGFKGLTLNFSTYVTNFSIYYHNKSQQDALFLNFILVKNSTCFGQTYCPSSGVFMLYAQQMVFVIFLASTIRIYHDSQSCEYLILNVKCKEKVPVVVAEFFLADRRTDEPTDMKS
jgi:hypothetical protein